MSRLRSTPSVAQWLECPCCVRAEVLECQVVCEHCGGPDIIDVCPVVNDPDVPCSPTYLFGEGQGEMCPYCGCEVGVSVEEPGAAWSTHDYERPCPPRVWPW